MIKFNDEGKVICGRRFALIEPIKPKYPGSRRIRKPYAKIVMEGVTHPAGAKLIRFRSVANAERHISTMKLQVS